MLRLLLFARTVLWGSYIRLGYCFCRCILLDNLRVIKFQFVHLVFLGSGRVPFDFDVVFDFSQVGCWLGWYLLKAQRLMLGKAV